MAKTDVKKYIKSLDRSSLEELIMDLYSARKEAKEFLEYVVKPNDKGKLEEYRAISIMSFILSVVSARCAFLYVVKQCRRTRHLIPLLNSLPTLSHNP